MLGRILFIADHPLGTAPAQRFRFEQYLEYLAQQGFQCELSMLLSRSDAAILYRPGHILRKALVLLRSILVRTRDLLAANQYDVIFIQREAFLLGTTVFERGFSLSRAKIVFDFDDAIWIESTSAANRTFAWLKRPSKVPQIISMADLVVCGNHYLRDYALRFHDNVVVIPTTIDTDLYLPQPKAGQGTPVCIGWSGSRTTIEHLRLALPVFRELRRKFGDRVRFQVIGDPGFKVPELQLQGLAWTKEDELAQLAEFDIGIMPLPADDWAQGKCGLKGLQYMALEIPTVMSPVGVNRDIISDGQNGFLADSREEWITKLSMLVESPDLRRRLGRAGRATVMERYSTASQRGLYLKCLRDLIEPERTDIARNSSPV